MITEFTKLEEGKKIDDQQFTLDLPKDVTIEEISGEDTSESVSLESAKEKLGAF